MRPSQHGPGSDESERWLGACAHQAVRETLDFGMTVGELRQVLEGHHPTDLVPPYAEEDPREYGSRAASEIMVRYLIA